MTIKQLVRFGVFALCLCGMLILNNKAIALAAQANIQIIEQEGEAVLGDDVTPIQAFALALNNARRAAIEQASGSIVHGSSVVYNFRLVSDLISSSTRGVIVREELLKKDTKKEGRHTIYFIKIRAHVKALPERDKSSIMIKSAIVKRYGSPSPLSTPVFQDRDEIQLSATVSDGSYIYAFGIMEDGSAYQIYPNDYFEFVAVAQGKQWMYPDEKQRDMGMKLKVGLPKDRNHAVETVLFVAMKEKRKILTDLSGTRTIMDIMKSLSEIDATLWTENIVGYEIRR